MEQLEISSWNEFKSWASDSQQDINLIYRGQADSKWKLISSLARYFLKNNTNTDEWRRRELKSYFLFRSELLGICEALFKEYEPFEILALMQHHGIPTRLLDFKRSPWIAAFFALKSVRDDAAIFVVNKTLINESMPTGVKYSGPTHIGGYMIAEKAEYEYIFEPKNPELRISSQNGCFLSQGHISGIVGDEMVVSKIVIPGYCSMDFLDRLNGMAIDDFHMFPDLDDIGNKVRSFIVSGKADVGIKAIGTKYE